MKPTKLICVIVGLVLAFVASNAKALPGGPEIEKLNFSLVLGQQALNHSNSAPNTYVSTINFVKVNNKALLNYLADAFHTNWPAGAQLALVNLSDFVVQHNTHVFVVDATGTNLLFDASVGINEGDTNVAYLTFDYDDFSISAGKTVGDPGNGHLTDYVIVVFHLYRSDASNFLLSANLNFEGIDTTEDVFSKRSDVMTDNAELSGDGDFNARFTLVSGKVNGRLKQELNRN